MLLPFGPVAKIQATRFTGTAGGWLAIPFSTQIDNFGKRLNSIVI
jgi:hypothetical protein